MNRSNIVMFIAIIIMLMVIVAYYTTRTESYSQIIEGLWIASEDFCKRSDLGGMLIYIGPKISSSPETRMAYVIMYVSNSVLTSKSVKIIISDNIIPCGFGYGLIHKTITFDELELDDMKSNNNNFNISDIMPNKLDVEIDIPHGKMIWKAYEAESDEFNDSSKTEKTIYAELFKSNS